MSKLTLTPGQKVRHLKTGNIYTIESVHHLHKVGNEWTSAVIYSADNPARYTTFSRSLQQFTTEFVNA